MDERSTISGATNGTITRMSDLIGILIELIIGLPAATSGPAEVRRGFPVRYTGGHPSFSDTNSSGNIYLADRDHDTTTYATSENVGFALPHDMITDVQFHADRMVLTLEHSGQTLTIHFDASGINERERKYLIKRLVANNDTV